MLSVALPFVNAKIAKGVYAVVFPDQTGNVYRMTGIIPNDLCYSDTRKVYLDKYQIKPIATLTVCGGILFAAPPENGDFDVEGGDAIKAMLEGKGYDPSYLIHLGFLSKEAGVAGVSTYLVANGAEVDQAVKTANTSYEAHVRAVRGKAANVLMISDRHLLGGDTTPSELSPSNSPHPLAEGKTVVDESNPSMTVETNPDVKPLGLGLVRLVRAVKPAVEEAVKPAVEEASNTSTHSSPRTRRWGFPVKL